MTYYDDKKNKAASKIFFMLFQIFMLLIVYGFVYSAFVAVKLAIAKYGLTFMTYIPETIALIGFPVILHKTRRMFDQEKRLRAVGLVMAWASVIIVFLYFHLSQLVKI
jgi:hypothetical protein